MWIGPAKQVLYGRTHLVLRRRVYRGCCSSLGSWLDMNCFALDLANWCVC